MLKYDIHADHWDSFNVPCEENISDIGMIPLHPNEERFMVFGGFCGSYSTEYYQTVEIVNEKVKLNTIKIVNKKPKLHTIETVNKKLKLAEIDGYF